MSEKSIATGSVARECGPVSCLAAFNVAGVDTLPADALAVEGTISKISSRVREMAFAASMEML
jgi:hypothetical protein